MTDVFITTEVDLLVRVAQKPGEWHHLNYLQNFEVSFGRAHRAILDLVDMGLIESKIISVFQDQKKVPVKKLYPTEHLRQVSIDLSHLNLPDPLDIFKAEAIEARRQMDHLSDDSREMRFAQRAYIGGIAVLGAKIDLKQEAEDWFSGEYGWRALIGVEALTGLITQQPEAAGVTD